MIRVGPAGWSYRDWEGPVYPSPVPRGFDRLAWLASFFDTVEVNTSFYRTPSPAMARDWLGRIESNPRFELTVKLERTFTHEKSWNRETGPAFRSFLEPLSGSGRLGAVLAQFPWSFRNDRDATERIDRIRELLPEAPLVVEVRHDSFDDPGFRDFLTSRSIGLANIDQPEHGHGIRPSAHVTSDVGYVRLHGRNRQKWFAHQEAWERYDYLYDADELGEWTGRAREMKAGKIFIVTNNHFRGQAVANALEIRSQLGQDVEIPESVAEYYPDRFEKPSRSEDAHGQTRFTFR